MALNLAIFATRLFFIGCAVLEAGGKEKGLRQGIGTPSTDCFGTTTKKRSIIQLKQKRRSQCVSAKVQLERPSVEQGFHAELQPYGTIEQEEKWLTQNLGFIHSTIVFDEGIYTHKNNKK